MTIASKEIRPWPIFGWFANVGLGIVVTVGGWHYLDLRAKDQAFAVELAQVNVSIQEINVRLAKLPVEFPPKDWVRRVEVIERGIERNADDHREIFKGIGEISAQIQINTTMLRSIVPVNGSGKD